jgi:hypothetical protein
MTFRRDLWKKLSFFDDRTPPWPCPHCSGATHLIKDKLSVSQSSDLPQSIRYITDEESNSLGYIQYRFTGIIVCDDCSLKISVLGYAHAVDQGRHPVNAAYLRKAGKVLFPVFFDPPLQIFSVAESCPREIRIQLDNSFALYWNDRASCANKIRTTIELLLDHQNVPKPTGITLHERIQMFKSQNELLGSFLESAKWIGNIGSHGIDSLSKIELLDGFELLHHVLSHLYVDQDKSLDRLIETSQVINRNKGRKPK